MSEIFYTGLYTAVLGLVLSLVAVCYKSKCKTIKCGCLEISRDVDIEMRGDLHAESLPSNQRSVPSFD